MRTIYVSHLHADHHLGVVGLLKEYINIQNSQPNQQRQPIFVIAPWQLLVSIYEYNQVEDIGLEEYMIPFSSFNLIPKHLVPQGSIAQSLDQGLFQGFLSTMNLKSFETCFVPHCPQAFAVSITQNSGFKFVYSGDCRPSSDFIKMGQKPTVLLHEATVADSEPEDALGKMHSTSSEAITTGEKMEAQHTLLTHFSQKWSRVPEFIVEWEKCKTDVEKYRNVGIAFDRMTVKVGDMWKLPYMLPAFEIIYQDEKERKAYVKRKQARVEKRLAFNGVDNTPKEKKRKIVHLDLPEQEVMEIGK